MRTSGKVLKDFENLRKALFDEEISHIAFMRDGKVEILYTQKYVDKLEDQLQQKENIIKEVREYIEEHKQKGYRIPMSDDYDFWNELNENEITITDKLVNIYNDITEQNKSNASFVNRVRKLNKEGYFDAKN